MDWKDAMAVLPRKAVLHCLTGDLDLLECETGVIHQVLYYHHLYRNRPFLGLSTKFHVCNMRVKSYGKSMGGHFADRYFEGCLKSIPVSM